MKYLVLIIVFLQFAGYKSDTVEDRLICENWMIANNKIYAAPELKEIAILNCLDNINFIRQHNRKKDGSRYGINKYMDRNRTEFNNTMNRAFFIESNFTDDANHPYLDRRKRRDATPLTVDWRSKSKYLQPVKNQLNCGSCWAFAATAVLESRIAIKYNISTVDLSEQNLVDCVEYGCGGSWPTSAYWYIKNNGQYLENEYKYSSGGIGKNGTCTHFKWKPYITNITKPVEFKDVSEDDLKRYVAAGPVVVAVDASAFMLYKDGIVRCPYFQGINHAVVLVGYGTGYWIVRNSWGTDWGDNGYIYITMNTALNCGVNLYVMYPYI